VAIGIVGTPQNISTSLAGENPAGFSVTVETGCNAAVWQWAQWPSVDAGGFSSVTLNGLTPDDQDFIQQSVGDESAAGVHVWYDPTVGSMTLDLAWTNAPVEGAASYFTCLQEVDTGLGAIAIDTAQAAGSATATVTLTGLTAGDFLLGFGEANGAVPDTSSGWSSVATNSNNSMFGRLQTLTADGSSEDLAVTSASSTYPTGSAVALREESGEPPGPGPALRQTISPLRW